MILSWHLLIGVEEVTIMLVEWLILLCLVVSVMLLV